MSSLISVRRLGVKLSVRRRSEQAAQCATCSIISWCQSGQIICLLDKIAIFVAFIRLTDILWKKLTVNIWIQPNSTQKNTKIVTQPDPTQLNPIQSMDGPDPCPSVRLRDVHIWSSHASADHTRRVCMVHAKHNRRFAINEPDWHQLMILHVAHRAACSLRLLTDDFTTNRLTDININIIFYIAQTPGVRPRAHYIVIISRVIIRHWYAMVFQSSSFAKLPFPVPLRIGGWVLYAVSQRKHTTTVI